ncbi:glycosyltransferase family 4 protein [uncultured Thiodictyon sp.]|uniref:MraY family glycosyltransferase n=1 Tax=uncultured Thiodictyon sp. TaxID=1846217 RepID=UPI0025E93498|nr:glycosyltransferase family 4 protein [uncultured Thiodictyon sp.]
MIPSLQGLAALPSVFLLSALLARWLSRRRAGTLALLDHPNARSLHQVAVPRSGGLAVCGALALMLAWYWLSGVGNGGSWHWAPGPAPLWWIAAAALPVALVSLFDDFGHVSRRLRFAVHLGAALTLLAGGLAWDTLDLPGMDWPLPFALAAPLSVLYVVWMVNLYNFMDGMDGFAGGMAVCGFAALALLGWHGGDPAFALAAAGIAAAAAGFLVSNFPPARIFLGDLGSSTFGLLAAGFSLWGAHQRLFPLWVAALAFSPFIVDATWTLMRRIMCGERIWEAHRSHHYQRLVLAGWGHRKTVLRAYALMAAAAACAVAAPRLTAPEQWLLLLAWAIIYLLVHVRVGLAERQGSTAS